MKKITLVTLITSASIVGLALAVGIPFAVKAFSTPEGRMPESVYNAIWEDSHWDRLDKYDWYYGAFGNGQIFLLHEDEPTDDGRPFLLGDSFFKMDRSFSLWYWQKGGFVFTFKEAYLSNFVGMEAVKSLAAAHERHARSLYESGHGKSASESAAWYGDRTGAAIWETIEPSASEEIKKAFDDAQRRVYDERGIEYDPALFSAPVIVNEYFGSFSGAHAGFYMRADSHFVYDCLREEIAGYEFFYPQPPYMKIVKAGNLYNLRDAYEAGVLSDKDVGALHAKYQAWRQEKGL